MARKPIPVFHVVLERRAIDQIELLIHARNQDEAEAIGNEIGVQLGRDYDKTLAAHAVLRQETISDEESSWEVNDSWKVDGS